MDGIATKPRPLSLSLSLHPYESEKSQFPKRRMPSTWMKIAADKRISNRSTHGFRMALINQFEMN
jgi:hypothetical protein